MIPGFYRWVLFIGYRNRLLNQQDVKRASNKYFGVPALDATGQGIIDSTGDALNEAIAKSLDFQKPVVIIARGGGGKTTLLARWSYLAIKNSLPLLKKFQPIFITPAYYSGNLIEAIANVLRQRDGIAIDSDIVQAQMESGKFLILFDGVSEIEDDLDKGLQEILRTAQNADYSNCRFIISTRPGLTFPQEVTTYYLQPLTPEVIYGLLHLYKLNKEQEHSFRSQLKLFDEKPIAPLLFSMILEQGKTAQISRTRSLLYQKYFRRLLREDHDTRWEGWNVILSEIANWFIIKTGNRGVGKNHEDLLDMISGKADNANAGNLPQKAKDYYGLRINNELDLLEKLKASGIMQRSRKWRFAHDTFEEYFAANYIISYIVRYEKAPPLEPWEKNDAQINSFITVMEFIREMADNDILNILVDSGLPHTWKEILISKENMEE
jgi:hypothetical protein